MKRLTLLSLLATACLPGAAAPLTPLQALEAALEARCSGADTPDRAQYRDTNRYVLAYSSTDDKTYVFNRKGGGFIIAAGDDSMGVSLLGYSDSGYIDRTNIPPALRGMLEDFGMSRHTPEILEAPRENIAPICKTKWDQKEPYFNHTPMSDGKHCVTGCPATSIAQVLNVYQYPDCGTGLASATVNDEKITLQLDDYPIDWDNIIDDYSGSYTTEQADAVANLMLVVGMAINMQYTASSSGAPVADEVRGLTEFLKFDKSIRPLRHDFYTTGEWNTLVYNELKAGHPVVYNGFNTFGGHSFVCDGYDGTSGDFFHINWGWSGLSDGYFLLSDLTPDEQGTGGSPQGYNKNQEALFGLMPDAGTEKLQPVIGLYGAFGVKKYSILRSVDPEFCASKPGANGYQGFSNLGIDPVKGTFGIRAVNNETADEIYVSSDVEKTLGLLAMTTSFSIPSDNMPGPGSYTVTPACLIDGKWYDISQDASARVRLTLDVTDTRFKFKEESIAAIQEITDVEITPSEPIVIDKPVRIKATVTARNHAFGGDIVPVLCEGNVIVSSMQPVNVSIEADESATLEWNEPFNTMLTEGRYNLYILREADFKGLYGPHPVNITTSASAEGIISDPDFMPVYYNLQGIRVDNPRDGIFIEVRGTKTRTVAFGE